MLPGRPSAEWLGAQKFDGLGSARGLGWFGLGACLGRSRSFGFEGFRVSAFRVLVLGLTVWGFWVQVWLAGLGMCREVLGLTS